LLSSPFHIFSQMTTANISTGEYFSIYRPLPVQFDHLFNAIRKITS
jgi:hypothetical protein